MNTPTHETAVIPNSLEDEANKAITCLYIMVDEAVADDVKQRIGAFVCQLKRDLDEAKVARDIQGKVAIDVIAERDQLRKVTDAVALYHAQFGKPSEGSRSRHEAYDNIIQLLNSLPHVIAQKVTK